ncbi:MAG: NADP-dependent isocitrate dehydrogenase [Treponema sp.]|jgi:isocitrate dehydrogenase|nr:NADP-dependent isocitrate dehydrogenase [Treponema sp.]
MADITMQNPIVEMDGDEMTRVLWAWIKEDLLHPFVELKSEYYDLSLAHREASRDQVTLDAGKAILRHQVGVKCATITPNAQRKEEYRLTRLWNSPNATIRSLLDGTVFREPILAGCIKSAVRSWVKPITIARHAYGDIYKGVEYRVPGAGTGTLVFTDTQGKTWQKRIADFEGPGILQGIHNKDPSIAAFAHACFRYALDKQQDLWFATKDTISKHYDHTFKEIFQETFEKGYAEAFKVAGIAYRYTLIDDAMARAIRSPGGFVWACKNYDGDILSDMVSSAFGSLGMMRSMLVSPGGHYEYEAAHGTVSRHYYRHLQGEETSTNPVATIFAWTGALRKRGELDRTGPLVCFARALERACLEVIEAGTMTGDLSGLCEGIAPVVLSSRDFIRAVRLRLEGLLAAGAVESGRGETQAGVLPRKKPPQRQQESPHTLP